MGRKKVGVDDMDTGNTDLDLEDTIEQELVEGESAQSEAVKSLIQVQPRDRYTGHSDVELKTELDERQIITHTKMELIASVLAMKPDEFNASNILGNIIEKLERKNISKNRAGRLEVVEVVRTPEQNMMMGGLPPPSEQGVSKLFKRKK